MWGPKGQKTILIEITLLRYLFGTHPPPNMHQCMELTVVMVTMYLIQVSMEIPKHVTNAVVVKTVCLLQKMKAICNIRNQTLTRPSEGHEGPVATPARETFRCWTLYRTMARPPQAATLLTPRTCVMKSMNSSSKTWLFRCYIQHSYNNVPSVQTQLITKPLP